MYKFQHNFSQSTNTVVAKSGMAKAVQVVSFVPPLYVVTMCILSFTYFLLPFLIPFSTFLPPFSFYPSVLFYTYFLHQHSFFPCTFSHLSPPSIQGSNCSITTVEVDGIPVDLEIWDTAGQEKFAPMVPLYYRRAQAAIVVYDITDEVHTYLHCYYRCLDK